MKEGERMRLDNGVVFFPLRHAPYPHYCQRQREQGALLFVSLLVCILLHIQFVKSGLNADLREQTYRRAERYPCFSNVFALFCSLSPPIMFSGSEVTCKSISQSQKKK